MVNIRKIANRSIQRLNPDVPVKWIRNEGYTVDENFRQKPETSVFEVMAQIQPVSSTLMKVMGLNLQETQKSVWMPVNSVSGPIRHEEKGGDKLAFEFDGELCLWRVTAVVERWPQWCHVIVTLEGRYEQP